MRTLWLAALLAVPAGATRPLTPPAPEFPTQAAWIGSKPLSLAMMRDRKAVLVVFLNPTDLHSLRLLSVLKAWFDRYALSQLMIVGVITPELAFERDAVWVHAEMKRLGVDFPVVLDGDRRLWKAYANDGWPAAYLIDRKGRIVFDHLGEGGYAELETELRAALADLTDRLPSAVAPPEPRTTDCGRATADLALGIRAAARPLKLDDAEAKRPALVVESREGEIAIRGKWELEADGLRLTSPAADSGDFARVVFSGAQALAALAPPVGRKTRFFVKLDDQWLYEGSAGRDVRFDADGRSFVDVGAPRLYDLVRDSGGNPHELSLLPGRAGGGVYGFQFADACIARDFPVSAAGAEIVDVQVRPFEAELAVPFEIAGGTAREHAGAFVRVRFKDGTTGHGEASPMAAFNGETRAGAVSAIRRAGNAWLGRDGSAWRARLEELEAALPRGAGAARAALGMALLDAWTRRAGLPLRALFGGAESKVVTDVTVTILPPEAAAEAARRIRAFGVRTVKIKVGKDPDSDAARVAAVAAVDPRFTLILNANQGYGPRESLQLLRLLKKRGLRPALFEQPAAADDWDGLARVARLGGVPVAADESLRGRADALGLARRGAVSVLNLKLMKMGLLEAWDCGLIARASGLGLMIGGMIETSLAMVCAAHFAAGLGGFGVVDLDTPLWLKRDPTRGLRLARGGLYDLSTVRRGIGVTPTA